MSNPNSSDDNAETSSDALAPALVEALLACATAPNAASTARLKDLAPANNPRYWDAKTRCEQWYDKGGQPYTIQFPAILEPTGRHSRLDPYFSLPTLKQASVKDVRTVKAQFQLRSLDNNYPPDAVICSKKAANTLMYAISNCENQRRTDGREAVPFMRSSGSSAYDPLHFVVHSEHLFPDAGEQTRDLVPEFSLEDFEKTDFTFTGDVLKNQFSPKKNQANGSGGSTRGVNDWKLKDMPDPQGHYHSAMDVLNLADVPVVVPDVRDSRGVLIHPSEYSEKFTYPVPVAVEIVLRLWTFGIDDKRPTGSRIYQTTLKSMKLLPMRGAATSLFTEKPGEPKGKRKADAPPSEASPSKRSTTRK